MKVSKGILAENWFHVQHGLGAAAAGTNDILVTSKGDAAVGDVVTTKGTVRADVKLGAGYDYAVLIEDASLRKVRRRALRRAGIGPSCCSRAHGHRGDPEQPAGGTRSSPGDATRAQPRARARLGAATLSA